MLCNALLAEQNLALSGICFYQVFLCFAKRIWIYKFLLIKPRGVAVI